MSLPLLKIFFLESHFSSFFEEGANGISYLLTKWVGVVERKGRVLSKFDIAKYVSSSRPRNFKSHQTRYASAHKLTIFALLSASPTLTQLASAYSTVFPVRGISVQAKM